MIAVITIDNIDKNESDYIHFKDKSQKAWNCNKAELIPNFAAGERYKIDYAETPPKEGRKYGSKYINRARFWKEEDGPNTWPDKEPYSGSSSYSGGASKGGNVKKDNYDPEIGKRQTAANVAGSICKHMIEKLPESDQMEAFAVYFPQTADIVLDWVNGGATKSDAGASGSSSGAASEGDADIPF